MDEALLIVAHGSRRAASNDEVRALTGRVRDTADGRFGAVECAFLELAEPGIPAGLEALIARGARRIRVVPYFLAAGRHVAEDIPDEIADVRSANPDVSITIAPYLGRSEHMAGLLLDMAAADAAAPAAV